MTRQDHIEAVARAICNCKGRDYDKLLENARTDTPLVALGFECQLFDEIPMQSHDIYMDAIVTEKAIYPGRGR